MLQYSEACSQLHEKLKRDGYDATICTIANLKENVEPWSWYSMNGEWPLQGDGTEWHKIGNQVVLGKLSFTHHSWGQFELEDTSGSIPVVFPSSALQHLIQASVGEWVYLPSWLLVPSRKASSRWSCIGPCSTSGSDVLRGHMSWSSWPLQSDLNSTRGLVGVYLEAPQGVTFLNKNTSASTLRVLKSPKRVLEESSALNLGGKPTSASWFSFAGRVLSCSPIVKLTANSRGVLLQVETIELKQCQTSGKQSTKHSFAVSQDGHVCIKKYIDSEELSSDHLASVVDVYLSGKENLHWSALLRVGETYVFSKLTWTTIASPTHKRQVLMHPNNTIARIHATDINLFENHKANCQQLDKHSQQQQKIDEEKWLKTSQEVGSIAPWFECDSWNSELNWKDINVGDEYTLHGCVTRIVSEAMLEIDHKLFVLLSHSPVASLGRGVRIGTYIRVNHALAIEVHQTQQYFGLTFRSQITIDSFSQQSNHVCVLIDSSTLCLRQLYSRLTLSKTVWLLRILSCFVRVFPKTLVQHNDDTSIGGKLSVYIQWITKLLEEASCDRELRKLNRRVLDEVFDRGCQNLLSIPVATPKLPIVLSVSQVLDAAIRYICMSSDTPTRNTANYTADGYITSWIVKISKLHSNASLVGWLETAARTGQLVWADATGCLQVSQMFLPKFGHVSKTSLTTARDVGVGGEVGVKPQPRTECQNVFRYTEVVTQGSTFGLDHVSEVIPGLLHGTDVEVVIEMYHAEPDCSDVLERFITKWDMVSQPSGSSPRIVGWYGEWYNVEASTMMKVSLQPTTENVSDFPFQPLATAAAEDKDPEQDRLHDRYNGLMMQVQDIRPCRYVVSQGDVSVQSRIIGLFWSRESPPTGVKWPISGDLIPYQQKHSYPWWFPLTRIGCVYKMDNVCGQFDLSRKMHPNGYGRFTTDTHTSITVYSSFPVMRDINEKRTTESLILSSMISIGQLMNIDYMYQHGIRKKPGAQETMVHVAGVVTDVHLKRQPANMFEQRYKANFAGCGLRLSPIQSDYSIAFTLKDPDSPATCKFFLEQRGRYIPPGLRVGARVEIRNATLMFRGTYRVRYSRVSDFSTIHFVGGASKLLLKRNTLSIATVSRLCDIALCSQKRWLDGGFANIHIQLTKLVSMEVGWYCDQCSRMVVHVHGVTVYKSVSGEPFCPGANCDKSKTVFSCTAILTVTDGTGNGVLSARNKEAFKLLNIKPDEEHQLAKLSSSVGTLVYNPDYSQPSNFEDDGWSSTGDANGTYHRLLNQKLHSRSMLCYCEVLAFGTDEKTTTKRDAAESSSSGASKRTLQPPSHWRTMDINVGGFETETFALPSVRLEVVHVEELSRSSIRKRLEDLRAVLDS